MFNRLLINRGFTIIFLLGIIVLASCKKTDDNIDHFELLNVKLIKDQKTPCLIVLNKKDTVQAKIKRRGGFSLRFDKKSFTFKLKKKKSFIDNKNAYKTWILNASYIDKTLMRHRLNYELFASFNPNHKIAESKYVRVVVNGENAGTYLLTEKIGRSKLGVFEHGGFIFKDAQIFKKRIQKPQIAGNLYHQNYPDQAIKDYNPFIDSLRQVLLSDSLSSIDKIFDIKNIMDWHILLMLSNNGDGVLKNFYLYRKNSLDKIKIVPWDYDHSFGRDCDGELNLMYGYSKWERNTLLNGLYQQNIDGYRSKLSERWFELRKTKTISVESLHKKIDKYERELAPYLSENFKIWPVDSKFYFDTNSFEKEINIMREFIIDRIYCLDEHFKK